MNRIGSVFTILDEQTDNYCVKTIVYYLGTKNCYFQQRN